MKKIYYSILVFATMATACSKNNTTTISPKTSDKTTAAKGENYQILSLTGKSGINEKGSYVKLNWSANNENKMHHYTIERATAGDNWSIIYTTECSKRTGILAKTYTDESLKMNDGDAYMYRVTGYTENNSAVDSKSVTVKFTKMAGI